MRFDRYTAVNVLSVACVVIGFGILHMFTCLWYHVLTDPAEPVTEETMGLLTSCFNFAFVYMWLAIVMLRVRKRIIRKWNYMSLHDGERPYRYDEPSVVQDIFIMFPMVLFACALGYYSFDWMMEQTTFVRGAFSLIPIVVTLMIECLITAHNRMKYTGALMVRPPAPTEPADERTIRDYRAFAVLSIIGTAVTWACILVFADNVFDADIEDRDKLTLTLDMLFCPFMAIIFAMNVHLLSRFSNLQWHVKGKGLSDDEYNDNRRALLPLDYGMSFGCLMALVIPVGFSDTFNTIEDYVMYGLACTVPFLTACSIYLLIRILYYNKNNIANTEGDSL